MPKNTTDAWVLRQGRRGEKAPAELERTTFELPEMGEHDVLAEPLYGCWEANMTHALERDPIDICRLRREKAIVLGNAGVVRVLSRGSAVSGFAVGDICCVVPIARSDEQGHTVKVLGYDAPNTMGMLAKRIVLNETNLTLLPANTRHSYQQWAGFPIRYTTAWDNWALTYGIWKLQFEADQASPPRVWAWGGGVSLAELQLAKLQSCPVAMIASTPERLELLQSHGITAIDRRGFEGLYYDEARYQTDRPYKARYLRAEGAFLDVVERTTEGQGVSIFIDNIGAPVFRATLRALSRLGIVTTAGWKFGSKITFYRATLCIGRQMLVHTHGCQRDRGLASFAFAEEHGWLPPAGAEEYGWDDVPQLAADYAAGRLQSYFPVFRVNPL